MRRACHAHAGSELASLRSSLEVRELFGVGLCALHGCSVFGRAAAAGI